MDTVTLKPQRLKDLVVNGGHAFDTRTGRSYSLNATAQAALMMLQEGQDGAAIVAALAARCGQHEAVVEAGVAAFFGQLGRIAQ